MTSHVKFVLVQLSHSVHIEPSYIHFLVQMNELGESGDTFPSLRICTKKRRIVWFLYGSFFLLMILHCHLLNAHAWRVRKDASMTSPSVSLSQHIVDISPPLYVGVKP